VDFPNDMLGVVDDGVLGGVLAGVLGGVLGGVLDGVLEGVAGLEGIVEQSTTL
jgi:hypothetical protein